MWPILHFIPKNHLSFLVGRLTRISKPTFLAKLSLRVFAKLYAINLDEAEKNILEYRSINELFTRRLKPDARIIEDGLISPVDGLMSQCGKIEEGDLIQAKGKNYSLKKLLGGDDLADSFTDGYFITIYLAPHNYHRIHSPFDSNIKQYRYIPGRLWPVNSWSVQNIDGLFSVNERLITMLDFNSRSCALVKVGATNVGCISLSFDNMQTNQIFNSRNQVDKAFTDLQIRKSEELATFEFGSTVILIFEKDSFIPDNKCKAGKEIRFGEKLGEIS